MCGEKKRAAERAKNVRPDGSRGFLAVIPLSFYPVHPADFSTDVLQVQNVTTPGEALEALLFSYVE